MKRNMDASMQYVSVSLDGKGHYIVGTDKLGNEVRMKADVSDLESLQALVRYLEREKENQEDLAMLTCQICGKPSH